jgi:putative toxin-antitoxin system antitoxin component (TIGR02293 family)
MSWLRRPQPGLGGRVPLELLVTQAGADQVETLLRRIDYGVYT